MAEQDDRKLKQARGLLRGLGSFSFEDEAAAWLGTRDRQDGRHPAAYDIESFAAGDLIDDALRREIAEHVEHCAACRREIEAFRSFLPSQPPAGNVVAFTPRPSRGRSLFTMPQAAAAAGGDIGRRHTADAVIRVSSMPGLPGMYAIAIQLSDPALRPKYLVVQSLEGASDEIDLPAPDRKGLIQLVRTATTPEEEALIRRLLDAPLDFLGDAEA